MKIAIFSDCYLPIRNGVSTSVYNASRMLASRGHEILILTTASGGHQKRSFSNISIEYCKPFGRLKLIKYNDFDVAIPHPYIFRRIMKFRPDVIHSHMPSFLGWTAVLCSKLLAIPLVGTYHAILPDFLDHVALPKKITGSRFARNFTWSYTRRYYGNCNLIISPSLATKRELMKNKIKKPVVVVSNGIDLENFYPRPKRRKGNKILHVGRLSYEKRIDVVIMAFKIMMDDDAVLEIIGSGPEEKNLRKIAGRDKRIKFLGHVEHSRLPDYYSGADIFVTASTIETEGLVVLEAMACGLPVVGVRMRALSDIISHGKTGFAVKPEDEIELARFMKKLLSDNDLREVMGRNAAEYVRRFSVDRSVTRLEMAYRDLIRSESRNNAISR